MHLYVVEKRKSHVRGTNERLFLFPNFLSVFFSILSSESHYSDWNCLLWEGSNCRLLKASLSFDSSRKLISFLSNANFVSSLTSTSTFFVVVYNFDIVSTSRKPPFMSAAGNFLLVLGLLRERWFSQHQSKLGKKCPPPSRHINTSDIIDSDWDEEAFNGRGKKQRRFSTDFLGRRARLRLGRQPITTL